eukprot:767305-Hanusia_phi.AAC.6
MDLLPLQLGVRSSDQSYNQVRQKFLSSKRGSYKGRGAPLLSPPPPAHQRWKVTCPTQAMGRVDGLIANFQAFIPFCDHAPGCSGSWFMAH